MSVGRERRMEAGLFFQKKTYTFSPPGLCGTEGVRDGYRRKREDSAFFQFGLLATLNVGNHVALADVSALLGVDFNELSAHGSRKFADLSVGVL